MRLVMTPQGLDIFPESPSDERYIERTLGLRHHLDSVPLTRISLDTNGALILKLHAQRQPSSRKGGRA